MAEIDLKEYLLELQKSNDVLEKFKQIRQIIGDDKDYVMHSLLYEMKEQEDEINEKIELLKKYSLCSHTNIKLDDWYGNDSHKDYYQDICRDCGKQIRTYDV